MEKLPLSTNSGQILTWYQRSVAAGCSVRTKEKLFPFLEGEIADLRAAIAAHAIQTNHDERAAAEQAPVGQCLDGDRTTVLWYNGKPPSGTPLYTHPAPVSGMPDPAIVALKRIANGTPNPVAFAQKALKMIALPLPQTPGTQVQTNFPDCDGGALGKSDCCGDGLCAKEMVVTLPAAPAPSLTPWSISEDPEFQKLAVDLWASRQDSMLAAFNDLARYVDNRMKGSK